MIYVEENLSLIVVIEGVIEILEKKLFGNKEILLIQSVTNY